MNEVRESTQSRLPVDRYSTYGTQGSGRVLTTGCISARPAAVKAVEAQARERQGVHAVTRRYSSHKNH